MHPLWQDFLVARGARIDQGRSIRFEAVNAASVTADTFVTDLSHLGLIRVDGPDARSFLQGQLSTNLSALNAGAGQFSSWSSPKGRVLSLLHVFLHHDAIHLALPHSLLAPVIKRLGMYVLRAKVTLSDASDALAGFGVVGDNAAAQLQRLGLNVPAMRWETVSDNDVTLMRLHGVLPRLLCWGAPARMVELARALDESTAWRSEDDWALGAILAGEPAIYSETSDQFVAQMLHLDALGGIDFKKGCYTGQEIIARAHYRGRVKRHLVRAEITAATRYAPGMAILAASQAVGTLLDARPQQNGAQAALAVIQEEQLANNTLTIGTEHPAAFDIKQIYRDLSV